MTCPNLSIKFSLSWTVEQGTGNRVQGTGYRVQGTGYRVQGTGYRVQGEEEWRSDTGVKPN